MQITVYKEISNPLPDFEDKAILQGTYIHIDDETIMEIGDRYKELLKMRGEGK